MIEIICENETGQTINLTNNPFLRITHIEGLEDPPISETITTTTPYMAGGKRQRSAVQERQIIISCLVSNSINQLRLELFKVFKAGQTGTLYVNGSLRRAKINYSFEELIMDRYTLPTTMQLVLRAPYPYYAGLEEIVEEIRNVLGEFQFAIEFPEEGIPVGELDNDRYVSIVNDGDITTGIEISFIALGTVVNPSLFNSTTNETIGVNITLQEGETLVINTHLQKKSIRLYSSDTTRRENQINNIMEGSKWLQLQYGDNLISYEADSGKELCVAKVKYNNEYEAII